MQLQFIYTLYFNEKWDNKSSIRAENSRSDTSKDESF